MKLHLHPGSARFCKTGISNIIRASYEPAALPTRSSGRYTMLYKPKFCCNCGESIERVEWNLLTSRRFCDVCSIENKKHDIIPRGVVILGVLAATFGMGSVWTSSYNAGSGSTLPSNGHPVGLSSKQNSLPSARSSANVPEPVVPSANGSTEKDAPLADATLSNANRSIASRSATYYCGALTKKGTPCSRKVKAAGMRCFQHEGKPAASGDN